jgi:DNA-binding IclR family transcriptional regulator
MKKAKSDYAIQTVVNALRVLEAFEDHDELGVTEIARALDLHKNNAFRLLATLEMLGYIEQRDAGPYRLGTRCISLGRAYARAGGDLLARGRLALDALAEETGETVHLAVLRSFDVVHLDGREAPNLLRVGSRVGRRLPAHCTALGKVLLACGEDSHQLHRYDDFLAAGDGLEPRTEATIIDRDKLFEHLRGVAVRRQAVDLEECDAGLCCVAAPVFDEGGRILAALSVSAPTVRVDPDRLLAELAPRVSGSAERLSAELGFTA